jgi:hypothetical protein
MKKMATIALIAASLVMGAMGSGNAAIESVGDPGRFWAIPDDGERGMVVMEFLDSFPGEAGSNLLPNRDVGTYPESDPTCVNLQDPKCASGGINYQAVIPFCTGPGDVNCTEEVGIIDESGKKTFAKFNRYFPLKAQNQFEGDPALQLPSGVAGSILNLPEASHDGGDNYYLSVVMNGGGSDLRSIRMSDFSVQLSPVKLESVGTPCEEANCRDTGWALLDAKDGGNNTGRDAWVRQGPGFSGKNYCVASSSREALCAQRYAFPAGFKYFVKVRALQSPMGWMHGRISDPNVSIEQANGVTNIEMQGVPVAVPAVYKMYRYPEMPQILKDEYDVATGGYKKDPNFINNPSNFFQGGRSANDPDPLMRNNIYAPAPYTNAGMEQLKLWIPFIEDKATALLSYWTVRTLSPGEMEGASKCFQDSNGVTGIVTTNATQYSAGPPAFSKEDGTLNYVVAAPHYGTKGEDFKGSYDLVMRSDVARCVYGFSKAPINATISITSADGAPQIATTVIGERKGWLYLQAKNFEFSAPIIKAKLTQEVVVEPTPTPTATATPTPTKKPVVAKKTTITCVKGKTSKKVTAIKPKCPTGFKVKK